MSDTPRTDAYFKDERHLTVAETRHWLQLAKAFARQLERKLAAARAPKGETQKLWLWRNFVDGKPEYWAFDNPFPINLDNDDPQTLGEPCGYAIVKPSRNGRPGVGEEDKP